VSAHSAHCSYTDKVIRLDDAEARHHVLAHDPDVDQPRPVKPAPATNEAAKLRPRFP